MVLSLPHSAHTGLDHAELASQQPDKTNATRTPPICISSSTNMMAPKLAFRRLQPAPNKPAPAVAAKTSFFDLPAELRIEIYKLALRNVTIHILPTSSKHGADTPDNSSRRQSSPHALTLTSRQVRNEVLPLMHSSCPIQCAVTDFNFDGLLSWIKRVPPHEEMHLKKNKDLTITLNTAEPNVPKTMESMRKWLHMRADKCRPQPDWKYKGSTVQNKVGADLRRRTKRMTEVGKQRESCKILRALGISLPTGLLPDPEEGPSRSSSQPAADSPASG